MPTSGHRPVAPAVAGRPSGYLIHDAFWLSEEAAAQALLGHATAGYAVGLARRAHTRRVLLAHHKPDRTDEALDRLGARFRADPSIAVAAEGQVIEC